MEFGLTKEIRFLSRQSKGAVHTKSLLNKIPILLFICFFSCQNSGKTKQEFTIRASLLVNEYHTWYKAFEYFGKRLSAESNGRIAFEVYPSEQLAKESEAIRMIQAGIIDMTTTGAVLTNWIEIAVFCEMPFLIKNEAQKDALINGEIGGRIKTEILEKTGNRVKCLLTRFAKQLHSSINP